MAITKRLFAASTNPETNARLSTPEAIVAEAARVGSVAAIQAHVRVVWYDRAKALAWLAECRSDRYSRDVIAALPPLEQYARVVALWEAWGKFWRALNVSPYGWARWRRLLERAWGYPSYAAGQAGWLGKLNNRWGNGANGGVWRDNVLRLINRGWTGAAPGNNASPAFRDNRSGYASDFWGTSVGQHPNYRLSSVVIFGDAESYALENVGNRPGDRTVLPNAYDAPTGERHRIWMQRDGSLFGGYQRGLDRDVAAGARVNVQQFGGNGASWQSVRGLTTLKHLWSLYWFTGTTPIPAAFDDWNNGFVYNGPNNNLFTNVPLRWYYDLIREKVGTAYGGLMTGPDDRGPDEGGNPASTGDTPMSVLDYLSSKTPEEIVQEVLVDLVRRNTEVERKYPQALGDLASAAEKAELDRQQTARAQTNTVNAIIGIASGVLGGVLSVAGLGPAGLAIGGFAGTAATFANNLASAGNAVEARRYDIFGRLFPPLEVLTIVDSEEGFRNDMERFSVPPPAPGSTTTSMIALAPIFNAFLTFGEVRVTDMPRTGIVEVGTDRSNPGGCRWEDAAQTVWRCMAPLGGAFWLRVIAPTGETRLARTGVTVGAPATIAWGDMLPEHQLTLTGVPEGTVIFVDGAPAMGAQSPGTAVVFAPIGSRTLRLATPTAPPMLVTLTLAGPTSSQAFDAVVSLGAAQALQAAQAAAPDGGIAPPTAPAPTLPADPAGIDAWLVTTPPTPTPAGTRSGATGKVVGVLGVLGILGAAGYGGWKWKQGREQGARGRRG